MGGWRKITQDGRRLWRECREQHCALHRGFPIDCLFIDCSLACRSFAPDSITAVPSGWAADSNEPLLPPSPRRTQEELKYGRLVVSCGLRLSAAACTCQLSSACISFSSVASCTHLSPVPTVRSACWADFWFGRMERCQARFSSSTRKTGSLCCG